MEIKEIESIIEGILFTAGNPVSEEKLAFALDMDSSILIPIVDGMIKTYKESARGVFIVRLQNSYQMISNPAYHTFIEKALKPKREQSLSSSALEILSIVAYNEPVTKNVIEQIRGTNCSYMLGKLLERGLLEERGRLDAPGKPILYGTTKEFLRCFSLSSLNDLPDISTPKQENTE